MNYPELEPAIARITATVPVERIILFGSRARGSARADSDYDLLVVVPAEDKTLATYKKLHKALLGLGLDIEVVLASPEDLRNYQNAWMTIFPAALREGQVLYAA